MQTRKMFVVSRGEDIEINRSVFVELLENSSVHDYADYRQALANDRIPLRHLISLSRKADIPYALFFSPQELVNRNIDRKNQKLLAVMGSKSVFSMNSRGSVQLRDVELIVKDLIGKQEVAKRFRPNAPACIVLNYLKGSRNPIEKKAKLLRCILGIDLSLLKQLNKSDAFEYLVSRVESSGVLVSQSAATYMPQLIRSSVRFSGLVVKDVKFPYIFLNNKDESSSYEPVGRRNLTLIILVVCISLGKFAPVSYDEQLDRPITEDMYVIAEELLMPTHEIIQVKHVSIDRLKELSAMYCITPSAVAMKLFRVGRISIEELRYLLRLLREEFEQMTKSRGGRLTPLNGFKKYNGKTFSRIIFDAIDSRAMGSTMARKILFLNKMRAAFLIDYRRVIQ
jgi:hypothetical protein